ncbi:hypothetical protein CERSUDRAFT_73682 [Gelatoporia subvermispora B]|uniref:Uncharacterized protein n=1 Tax=Ceriporiopsis subvermispora (strain B) TaxID=914234 RepID=M2QLJ5_CERS8|nr:hypothetical protein CERSUDRAFT_73682 [Gelatoporia subvermispora B]
MPYGARLLCRCGMLAGARARSEDMAISGSSRGRRKGMRTVEIMATHTHAALAVTGNLVDTPGRALVVTPQRIAGTGGAATATSRGLLLGRGPAQLVKWAGAGWAEQFGTISKIKQHDPDVQLVAV